MEQEDFYCVLKLVSGEEIFSLIMIDENDGDPVIVLQNPVVMKTSHNHQGSYLKIKPWIEMSSDDFFIIKLDKVITMTESHDQGLIDIYNSYIIDDGSMTYSSSNGQIKPSSKMGYISSVDDARNNLEKIFKNL
jgi:hypothetical protein